MHNGGEHADRPDLPSLHPSPRLPMDLSTTVLDLSNSKIDSWFGSITAYGNLQELAMSMCCLETLPSEVGQLVQLTYLDVSRNRLTEFPDSIGNLHKMMWVDARFNKFTKFPEAILRLKSLKGLELSNERPVEKWPMQESYGALPKLYKPDKELSSQPQGSVTDCRNAIRELPDQLADSALSLVYVSLGGNPMHKPPLEFCYNGLGPIREYLKKIAFGSSLFSPHSLCMLGDTCAGKTSIVLSLQKQEPQVTAVADRTRVLNQNVVYLNGRRIPVNDFGGHEVYQTVLPIFLPPKGTCIIAYDMTESWETQASKVRRWINTLISRSPEMQVIVVGTHADQIQKNGPSVSYLKNEMEKFVKTILTDAVDELKSHLEKRESWLYKRSLSEGHSLDFIGPCNKHIDCEMLRTVIKSLKECRPVFLAFSGVDDSAGDGLSNLAKAIAGKLPEADVMPWRWIQYMESLREGFSCKQESPLTLENAKEQFFTICQEENEDNFKDVLNYLVGASAVIWLSHHSRLRKYIFHRVDYILRFCQALLHHERHSLSENPDAKCSKCGVIPELLRQDFDKYDEGLISDVLLSRFLSEWKDTRERCTMLELLKEFDLIASSEDNCQTHMIIPCRLKEVKPVSNNSCTAERLCIKLKVHIRVNFFTNVMPLAFFETSLASLLSAISRSRKADPTYWRNGIEYACDLVTLRYMRNGSTLDITAEASSIDSVEKLWIELGWLLESVAVHIRDQWPGMIPSFLFLCPYWVYDTSRQDIQAHGRFGEIDEILEKMKPAVDLNFLCKTCEIFIPKAFFFVCQKEHLDLKQVKAIETLVNALEENILLQV